MDRRSAEPQATIFTCLFFVAPCKFACPDTAIALAGDGEREGGVLQSVADRVGDDGICVKALVSP